MEQRIGNFSIFKGLGKKYIKNLSNKACDFHYKPGETIIKEGDKDNDEVYIISHGKAEIFIGRKKINTLEEGDLVGELAVFLNQPRQATVKAKTPVCVIKVNKEWFIKVTQETPNGDKIKEIIAQRINHNASKFGKVKRYKN